jgi:hypothetical protein
VNIRQDRYQLQLAERITVRKLYRYYSSLWGRAVARYECTELTHRLDRASVNRQWLSELHRNRRQEGLL